MKVRGFLAEKKIKLNPRGSGFVNLNVETMLGSENNSESNKSQDVDNNGMVLILIPCCAIFSTLNVHGNNLAGPKKWMLDSYMIRDLNPENIKSFRKVQGKIISESESDERAAPCFFCDICKKDAMILCGNPIIGGKCRPEACTSYCKCSCIERTCIYICKPSEQCC